MSQMLLSVDQISTIATVVSTGQLWSNTQRTWCRYPMLVEWANIQPPLDEFIVIAEYDLASEKARTLVKSRWYSLTCKVQSVDPQKQFISSAERSASVDWMLTNIKSTSVSHLFSINFSLSVLTKGGTWAWWKHSRIVLPIEVFANISFCSISSISYV